jgi:hypothetical protein
MYKETDHSTFYVNEENEHELLANFTARITEEIRETDGVISRTTLRMDGRTKTTVFEAIEITADEFPSMAWVMNKWGVSAVIQPGTGKKDHLRAAIQTASKPSVKRIYKTIGWITKDEKRGYLHAGGVITAKGNDDRVTVKLTPELQKYNLNQGTGTLKDAWQAVLHLLTIGPFETTATMLCGTLAPLYGPVDFALHVSGRTGTYKSELVSLFQSFYGPEMDARHLPGSWSSTGNALECQAYYAANAVFVIDDFVPGGTSYQSKMLQATADKIIRAQGNQGGRARLTDMSSLQNTYYPRGMILSTGEDVPQGHSVRARMMIMEMTPGDIITKELTIAQRNRTKFSTLVNELITDLAKKDDNIELETQRERDRHLEIGHSRTPQMLARLITVATHVIAWAEKRSLTKDGTGMLETLIDALKATAGKQGAYLQASDPMEILFGSMRLILGSGKAHIRSLNGGIPAKADLLGWTETRAPGEVSTWRAHGPCIGWVDWHNDELLIEHNAGITAITQATQGELAVTRQTLLKRMKDSGVLKRTDETRQRTTVRVTADGHQQTVIVLKASNALQIDEMPE